MKIIDVRGRRVWDSRGRPTVEVEVLAGRGSKGLVSGRAIAPAGASIGSAEARELRDGGQRLLGLDVQRAVKNVNSLIRDALRAASAGDQAAIDRKLIELDGTPDKSRLGANAIVAPSPPPPPTPPPAPPTPPPPPPPPARQAPSQKKLPFPPKGSRK